MNRTQHYERAEQLLEEAHTTHDQISRRLILAEAQVHATLALGAADGQPSPPQTPPVRDIEPRDPRTSPTWPAGHPGAPRPVSAGHG